MDLRSDLCEHSFHGSSGELPRASGVSGRAQRDSASAPALHPLSTWHYWENVIEKFRKARLYPWTDKAAFRDGDSFRSWRVRAELEAPVAVRSWLRKKGDEVQTRLDGAMAPMTIGDLETFLDQRVGPALATGRGRIQNLRRLDIRLGLIALRQNRQLTTTRLAPILRPLPARALYLADHSTELSTHQTGCWQIPPPETSPPSDLKSTGGPS